MEQLNRIEIRGTVGNVRLQTVGEKKVARFTVATNFAYKDKAGNPVIETTWHNVNAWEGRDMDDLEKLDKGVKVYVNGRLRIQKFTNMEDQEKIGVEIVARRLAILNDPEPMQHEFM